MAADPEAAAAAYERRVVTILFADLVGFTTLGERLDAEDVAAIQDRYFGLVRDTVGRHGGVLEKFIGDAAMAVFGVPRARDDDSERAVRAGLAIVAGMERLAADVEALGGALGEFELAVRVGIATGEVAHAVGGLDAGRVTGDTVNVAARLQAAATIDRILVDEATALAVADSIELEPAEAIPLKGKAASVRAAHVAGVRAQRSRDAAMGGLRSPMLGRDAEMALLRSALERVRRDRTNETWLLVAPPGTGKSRLLDEFGATTTVRRARFLATDTRPFGAIHDLAREVTEPFATGAALAVALEAGGMAPPRAAVVAVEMGELLDPAAPRVGAGGGDRASRFATWLEGFTALAARAAASTDGAGTAPETWLIEDLHWAGADPIAFLEAAQRTETTGGRLAIATARPGLLDRLPPHWRPGSHVDGWHLVDVSPLAAPAAADLVRALVGDALPGDLVARIVAASDGNCLYIEELLRSWASSGVLAPAAGAWQFDADRPALQVPTTVQAIYAGQLDDLPEGSRRLARRGSVAGRQVPTTWLADIATAARVSPTSGATRTSGAIDPLTDLEPLLRRQFLDGPLDAPPLGDAYGYRHALLRDAAYASLSRAERAALHIRFANVIEHELDERAGDAAELIGLSYEAAVDAAPALGGTVAPDMNRLEALRRAATWLERAAESAQAAGAREHAAELFGRSLARTADDEVLAIARRERRIGEALSEGGDLDIAGARLRSAADRYRAALTALDPGSPGWAEARSGLAGAANSLAWTLQEQLLFEAAWTVAESVAAEIGGDGQDLPSAWLQLRAATAHVLFSDEPNDVIPAANAAMEVGRRLGDQHLDLEARIALMSVSQMTADPIDRQIEELVDLAERLGRHDVVVRALRFGAATLAEAGKDGEPLLARAADVATSHGLREGLGWVEYARAELAFATGDWDRATEAARRAIELGMRHAYHRIVVRSWYVATPIALARGDRALLRTACEWHEAMRPNFPDSAFGRLMHRGFDLRAAEAGFAAGKEPDVEWLLPSFDQEPEMASWLEAVDMVLRQWLERGLVDAVEDGLARMERSSGDRSALSIGARTVMRARWSLARRDRATAADLAREAIALLRPVQAAWWIAKALRLLERAGNATGDERAEAHAIEVGLGSVAPAA